MEWTEFPAYDMIWTDPPWEQKMVNFFQTIMKRDSGKEAKNTITAIITQLAMLSDNKKLMVVEYSITGHELVVDVMKKYGHTLKAKHQRTYDKRPFLVLIFNQDIDLFDTKNESELITKTLDKLENINVVFDPFAGIGFTAKAVRKAGKKYIGSEINPHRFKRLEAINK